MRYPIKNKEVEQFAQDLAAAIKKEDTKKYEELMKSDKNPMDKMMRWEIIALKDRIHHLVEIG